MPQRFLRPGLRTSPRWNSVSHEAARLYIALLTQVDDWGRYDGRNAILWADAFTVWNEMHPDLYVSPHRNVELCAELGRALLVFFYEVDGRRYVQLLQWQERHRGVKSKWPEPPPQTAPQLSAAPRSGFLPPSPSPSPSPSSIKDTRARARARLIDGKIKTGLNPNPAFAALKLANRIIANETGWHYDNCKVDGDRLNPASLQTVILPFVERLSEKKILSCWSQAVHQAHAAKVDKLARNATAYAVECFKQQLQPRDRT
jgi:hypothetical protein